MKKAVLLFVMIIFFTGSLSYAGSPVKAGMKLYKKHLYEDAGRLLYSYLPSLKPGEESTIYLSLGMVYLSNARLYRELGRTSIFVHLDYLKKLDGVSGKSKSRLVKLYLAQAYLKAGKPEKAAAILQRFISGKSTKPKDKEIGKINLGVSYFLLGKPKKAKRLWSSIKTTDPEVLSELAKAYCKAGLKNKNPLAICDEALKISIKSGKVASIQVIKNIIWVYAATEQVEKGLDLIKSANLKAFSHEEVMAKNKTIRFYDLSLLSSLSLLYGKASIKYLEKASADEKVKGPSLYYLGTANAYFGEIGESTKVFEQFVSSTKMPARYKNTAKVRLAENHYLKGNKTQAKRMLSDMAQSTTNPYMLSDILLACSRLQAECHEAVKKASTLAETGEGKEFARVNYALGKYHMQKNDYVKAAIYMEAGRDKSNKNKIEYNDPAMLVSLARAYYQTKKFSEALEIYFEISKQFSSVRQIQIAMQGVYSMEQKSAGDAKIL
ncbi:MAG: tetratricopeptide repeat protein [Deltaproteobacteria bacterium]|nr:tetratricopeptide repeat protein [Deltaproteobacteria bacterium]